MIQLTLTLKMTTPQVVETSVTVNNNSPIQDYVHLDDQTQPTFQMTPGFKPFTRENKTPTFRHPRRPRGSQSSREKRRDESFRYGRKSPWVPKRIKVRRWNERVRAKRCDAVDWDCFEMSLVFRLFSTSVRACDVVCPIRHCCCHWIMAAWFVFLHFFLVPLCWYAVFERQMLRFFAGGLVGVDKHLFRRVSLITSMTLRPLHYIFVLLLANVDVIPKKQKKSN